MGCINKHTSSNEVQQHFKTSKKSQDCEGEMKNEKAFQFFIFIF